MAVIGIPKEAYEEYMRYLIDKHTKEKAWKNMTPEQKAAIMQLIKNKSNLPSFLNWIPGVITAIDDAQDLIFSALYLITRATNALPNPILKMLGYTLGGLDIASLAVQVLGMATTPGIRKKKIRGQVNKLDQNLRNPAQIAQAFLNDNSLKGRLAFGLQAAQAMDTIGGTGLKIGGIFGAISELTWGGIRDAYDGLHKLIVSAIIELNKKYPDIKITEAEMTRYLQETEKPRDSRIMEVINKYRKNWKQMLKNTFFGIQKIFLPWQRSAPQISYYDKAGKCLYSLLTLAPILHCLDQDRLELIALAQVLAIQELKIGANRRSTTNNQSIIENRELLILHTPTPVFLPYENSSNQACYLLGHPPNETARAPLWVKEDHIPTNEEALTKSLKTTRATIDNINNEFQTANEAEKIIYKEALGFITDKTYSHILRKEFKETIIEDPDIISCCEVAEFNITLDFEYDETHLRNWYETARDIKNNEGNKFITKEQWIRAANMLNYNIKKRDN